VEFGAKYGCDLPRIRYDQSAHLLGACGVFVGERPTLMQSWTSFGACPGRASSTWS
jgi:hypothetical protein